MNRRGLATPAPHLVWTVACVGLLGLGGFLESSVADAHRIDVETLGDHSGVSLALPALVLAGSVLCGAWPAFQATWRAALRGQFSGHVIVVLVVGATFGFGHMFEAGTIALAFSVGWTLTTRLRTSLSSGSSDRRDG